MNKGEFVDAVAAKGDLSKADAASAVDAVLEAVTDAMKQGDQVTLVGFGTFFGAVEALWTIVHGINDKAFVLKGLFETCPDVMVIFYN